MFNIQLKSFKNKHYGESCYILGDGPSIKSMDFSNFNDFPSICCGKLFLRNDFNSLKCLYYAIPEPFLFAPNILKKQKYLKDYFFISKLILKKILKNKKIIFFINVTNILSVFTNNVRFIHRYINNPIKKISPTDPFAGSFITCLSLAHFMGFKKIYLIGFDSWTNKNSSDIRWFEKGIASNKINNEIIDNDLIEYYKTSIEIKSILLNKEEGLNFDSITYFNFCGKLASYKENFELTTTEILNVLKTQPEYKIE